MARAPRVDVAGYCYHVLNRANARYRMFKKDGDFEAFERVLEQAVARAGPSIELMAYCVMPNHWHLVIRTHEDGAMGAFMKWLTTTHAGRYRVAHGQGGLGHLYQGRYKSFVIADDAHFLTVCRYVERNAARAKLAGRSRGSRGSKGSGRSGGGGRAEDWRWSSLWRWRFGTAEQQALLSPWPAPATGVRDAARFNRPKQWLRTVNTPLAGRELESLRTAAERGRPFGTAAWVRRMVTKYGLESTVRRPGRPKKEET